ncbi:DUF2523 domain-containing protein [Pseudomonas sp. ABC1]|uniref:DUF2523 domain-containing protein n=1 Tax=Pseudomonas sp. ABC1 TaxID=2748080 RepID=UPI0015C2F0F6|nr:DUF2523 domain-containing protein [Pseudomonas sp. ABC1]QLF92217.1 DUF2523 domain-containing protein [Pseudomonas sp. ABC1]
MPAFVVTILLSIVGHLAARVLWSLGVGIATYTGLGWIVDQIETLIRTSYNGALAGIPQIMSLMGFDHAISIIFAAVSVRMTLMGLSAMSDTIKSWTFT